MNLNNVCLDLQNETLPDYLDIPRWLNPGQRNALYVLGQRLSQIKGYKGCVIADEVGMGKTRIAVALAKAVTRHGGRVCVVIPPGLGAQWKDEFAKGGFYDLPDVVASSLNVFLNNITEDEGNVWLSKKIVLVSHTFTNWRFSNQQRPDYWGLLPLVFRRWYEGLGIGGPRPWNADPFLNPVTERYAGLEPFLKSICDKKSHSERLAIIFKALRINDDQVGPWNPLWREMRNRESYIKQGRLKPELMKVIGIGLGRFDLVIIDEAHKARGQEAHLSKLLENVIWTTRDCHYLAMTATPVELDISDWKGILRRVGLPEETIREITEAAKEYTASLQPLRDFWRTGTDDVLAKFKEKAERFQEALQPYMIRRDKGEDEAVKAWKAWVKKNKDDQQDKYGYREFKTQESTIKRDDHRLTPRWKKAICAAEALSVIADVIAKNDREALKQKRLRQRLRLTVGTGHGIASLLDTVLRRDDDVEEEKASDEEDKALRKQDEAVGRATPEQENDPASRLIKKKRRERITWWTKNLSALFPKENGQSLALFEHPAILKAADLIEGLIARGERSLRVEKVLVFGKFTLPLRALTALLNAREMIRRLKTGKPWPQEVLSQGRPETEAGLLRQAVISTLGEPKGGELSLSDVIEWLGKQYNRQDTIRTSFRQALIEGNKLEKCLTENNSEKGGGHGNVFGLTVLKKLRDKETDQDVVRDFCNAIMEIAGFSQKSAEEFKIKPGDDLPPVCAKAFYQLLEACTDQAKDDAEDDPRLWNRVRAYLKKEHHAPRGTFARLMNGQTGRPARRVLQAAFNRPEAWPRVLVAQSMVGREGLNLHESCRHVVLLHPEWNPGVVEQQIGRVDRCNSLWSKYVLEDGNFENQIEIHPIIFEDTYDEHNWEVLGKRWRANQAQLKGEIIPPEDISDEDKDNPDIKAILKKIQKYAPKFSPKRT